jgi:hypothetical protein
LELEPRLTEEEQQVLKEQKIEEFKKLREEKQQIKHQFRREKMKVKEREKRLQDLEGEKQKTEVKLQKNLEKEKRKLRRNKDRPRVKEEREDKSKEKEKQGISKSILGSSLPTPKIRRHTKAESCPDEVARAPSAPGSGKDEGIFSKILQVPRGGNKKPTNPNSSAPNSEPTPGESSRNRAGGISRTISIFETNGHGNSGNEKSEMIKSKSVKTLRRVATVEPRRNRAETPVKQFEKSKKSEKKNSSKTTTSTSEEEMEWTVYKNT